MIEQTDGQKGAIRTEQAKTIICNGKELQI